MTVDEYNDCVKRCADNVYRFVLKNIRDEDKAGDIVQDAYEKMWRHHENVDSAKGKSYLFSTAYHVLIDHTRREKHSVRMEEADLQQHSHERQYSDVQEVLHQALAKLPEDQRMVVMMRDYEGYSYEEIGEITGLSESQVKVYIYRARVFLRKYGGGGMNINRENYEVWFIDFLDGKLDEKERQDFNAFLLANSDLQEELNAFEEFKLEPIAISYDAADQLHKNESDLMEIPRPDYLLVKQLEEGLSGEEEKELAANIRKDESLIKRGVEFQQTKLAIESIPYERKSSLLKNRIRPLWITIGRVAAAGVAVALLMTFWNSELIFPSKTNELAMQTLHSRPAIVAAPDIPAANLAEVSVINRENSSIISKSTDNIESSEVLNEVIPETEIFHQQVPMVGLTPKPVKLELAGNVPNAYEAGLRHMMPMYLDINRDQKQLLTTAGPKKASTEEGSFLMKSLQLVDRVSGDLVNFDKLYDEDGNYVAYNFKAGYFEVERKIRR